MQNKDQRLLEEAYVLLNEFNEDKWLDNLEDYTFHKDGTLDVNGDVDLSEMNLTQLPFKFGKVTGDFNCSYNELSSTENMPRIVGGSFYCYHNPITSLIGGPEEVGWDYSCSETLISSFDGIPQHLRIFYCTNCKRLRSLKGLPDAQGYELAPFTNADVRREEERVEHELEFNKHVSPTVKAAWGTDTFADL